MENHSHILIFKTNIRGEAGKLFIKELLDSHELIKQCNLDQHDIDCVLRVVSFPLKHNDIINLVHKYGFECAELE